MAMTPVAHRPALVLPSVEERTQVLGRALLRRARAYSPPPAERMQNALMTLMADDQFRSRLLRLVDVLSAPGMLEDAEAVKALSREYLDRPFSHLPKTLAGLLRMGLSDAVPAPVVALFVRRLIFLIADRFITHGGPSGLGRTLAYLNRHGRYPSFDLLGEAVLSDQEAENYKGGYLELIAQLGRRSEAGARTPGGMAALQCSIKLSSLVADFNPIDPEGTLARVRAPFEEILVAARSAGIGVTIDMEQYAYRDLTWYLFTRLFGRDEPFGDWPDAGVVLQAYLVDSPRLAREMVRFAHDRGAPFQVRLVKGAYWDYETIVAEQKGWPSPVFASKPETDQNFEELVWRLLEAYPYVRPAAASHNLRSHAYAEAVREQLELPSSALEHQVLFRTAEWVGRALTDLGWDVRDYVPVGELLPGMAYLVRRILENSSQVGFLMRSRLGEDAAHLLRDPRTEVAAAARLRGGTGFWNHPPARLFRQEEREAFRRALVETRAAWGAEYPLRLGTEEVRTGSRHESRSPSHPEAGPVGTVHFAGPAEAARAIELAGRGFAAWSARSIAERTAVLGNAAEILAAERDRVGAWIVHEAGKNWEGALADVDEAIDYFTFYGQDALRRKAELEAGFAPRGVVGVIPPWNFPIAVPAGMTAAALAAGNAVILKPADQTPIISHLLTEILHRAGVPGEALIYLPGAGETVGQALVESPDVDMIAFTGSRAVGTEIYRAASRVAPRRGGIKRVVAEMGGKNPILVFADADLDEAIAGILQSAFGHANQKCSAAARVFVQRAIYPRLKRRLVEAAASLKVGPADDPDTFVNPLIDEEACERVLRYAGIARQEGQVILDLARPSAGACALGPMIVELSLAQASTATVAREEIFGPVLALIPFDDTTEAIRAVNATPYALTAGVFSRRPSTIARVRREVRAGNLYVNREITGAQVGLEPFGGFQLSGTGPKAGGAEYLLAFLRQRDLGSAEWGARSAESPSLLGVVGGLRPAIEGTPPHSAPRTWHIPLAGRVEILGAAFGFTEALRARARELEPGPPPRSVPGQRTEIDWSRPRGWGLIAVDDGAPVGSLSSLTLAALLAGNGVTVVVPNVRRAEAEALVLRLHDSGVPEEVLALAPEGTDLGALAREEIAFAATDLNLRATRALLAVLGETLESGRTLKALLAIQEGPRPGAEGFLRQFTLPTTVAIRTLRYGADLDLS